VKRRRLSSTPISMGQLEGMQEEPVGPQLLVVDDLVDIGDDIKEGL
jgi:hypothetical protein